MSDEVLRRRGAQIKSVGKLVGQLLFGTREEIEGTLERGAEDVRGQVEEHKRRRLVNAGCRVEGPADPPAPRVPSSGRR